MPTTHVACVAFTHIPELGGWVTICQQRNEFNAESPTGYKKQSFAGVFSPMFNEKMEANDEGSLSSTLSRGANEELDHEAADILLQILEKSGGPFSIYDEIDQDGDRHVVFVASVPSTILKEIRGEVSGTFKLRTKSQIEEAVESTDGDKNGVQDGQMKFRPHHLIAMRKAWKWLESTHPSR
ncbi:MAG: hypothetical protein AAB534_01485 [Patescibacteria group bacterium]